MDIKQIQINDTTYNIKDEVAREGVEHINEILPDKANIDGSYDSMAVGIAKNLEGRKSVEGSFFERTTGGEAEIANGVAQLEEVQGNTGVVNQLVQNGNFVSTSGWKVGLTTAQATLNAQNNILTLTTTNSATISTCLQGNKLNTVENHKYFTCADLMFNAALPTDAVFIGSGGYSGIRIAKTEFESGVWRTCQDIFTRSTGGDDTARIYFRLPVGVAGNSASVRNFMCFDLTLMYGSGYEPATVEEFEQRLKDEYNLTLDDYIVYTQGKLVNVTFEGIESTGRNLLDPTTNKARILGAYSEDYDSYYGITGTYGTLTFVSDKGETTTITPDSEGKFLLEESGYLTVANPSNDCCVFIWWDGSKTDYIENDKEVAYLDVKNIWGKAQGSDTLVQAFPYGMGGQEGWHDILKMADGATVVVKNSGRVDLGTLEWTKQTSGSNIYFRAFGQQVAMIKASASPTILAKILCAKYLTGPSQGLIASGDKHIGRNDGVAGSNAALYVYDAAYTDAATFITAMDGVYLEYQLATPITLTDLVYKNSPYFADGTPVTLPMNYKVDNWGMERILPQNISEEVVTAKPIIFCKYSIDAVEDLDTLHTQIDNLDEKKPNKEGTYPNMVVGAAKALEGNTSVPAEYTFRKVDDSVSSGLAMLKQIKGRSLVWNQMLRTSTFEEGRNYWSVSSGVTITLEDGIAHVTIPSRYGEIFGSGETLTTGHKYAIVADIKADTGHTIGIGLGNGAQIGNCGVYVTHIGTDKFTKVTAFGVLTAELAAGYNNRVVLKLMSATSVAVNLYIKSVVLFDLTQMFGENKEPATATEFEALYNKFPYGYNTGEIINNKTTAIESTGFNQWDEEWELGQYRTSDGAKTSPSNNIRCKNLIPVIGGKTYYGKTPTLLRVCTYDANKNYIGAVSGGFNNFERTFESNVAYISISTLNDATTTYNHDICINISNSTKNGTYEPHEKFILNLNLPTATGKLNGEGDSVVIFPDGMRGGGTAYDSLIVDEDGWARRAVVRMTSVDMGTLNYTKYESSTAYPYGFFYTAPNPVHKNGTTNMLCSRYTYQNGEFAKNKNIFGNNNSPIIYIIDDYYADAASFKAAMNGVELIYELAEPLEYVLDTPIYVGYQVRAGGTEKRLPEDTSSEVTAPFACDVIYPLDAVGFINDANEKFINKESMTGFLSQLGTAMGGTWTMTWDATTQKYNFTFVSNS